MPCRCSEEKEYLAGQICQELQRFHTFIIKDMQAEQNNLISLPRRAQGQPVKLPAAQRREFLTNHYAIKLPHNRSTIYQFTFDASPDIPQDSKELLYQVIKSVKRELREKISFLTASGNMIWGMKQIEVGLNLESVFKLDEISYKFDIIVKPTKTLDIAQLLQTHEGSQLVFQVFNNKLKAKLRDQKMDEITRGKYFNKQEVVVQEVGLNVLRGFKFTLCPLRGGLTLQIDVCSKVFRAANLLEEISKMPKDSVDNLVGETIITRYGRIRTYKILNIVFNKNPKTEFFHEKRAGKVTFAKYYEESYGLKVKAMNQPLVEVCLRTEKKMVKGEIIQSDIIGYLIPEFVSLTGMSDEQRSNYNTMKAIAPYTKLAPHQKMEKTHFIRDVLNKGEELEIGDPLKVEGFQLNEPEVKLNSQIFKSKDGTLRFKDRLKGLVALKDWVLVYTTGKNSKYDDEDADNFFALLQEAAPTFGINISEPGFLACSPNLADIKHKIDEDVKKNGKPQIIVMLMNPQEERLYGEIKKYTSCELGLPAQMVKKKTVSPKSKNPLSAASMILIQMNQKIGGVAWEVVRKSEYLSTKKMMYGAFSISKGAKGYTLAFVGTLNAVSSKIFSFCKTGYKSKEDIPKADFETVLTKWAQNFVKENQEGPEVIIVYREGLSIPQIEVQLKPEIEALNSVIKKIAEKTKKPNYNPEVMYVTVNKQINARIFNISPAGASQGKFAPKVLNPSSGSCVFDELSVNNLFDFHLTAQQVTQGTCTPTHYIVVYNKSKISQEALAQFTYEQCFNYYNWQGAVKVPACLQCADKLATLVGESIKANITEGEIMKSFFFL